MRLADETVCDRKGRNCNENFNWYESLSAKAKCDGGYIYVKHQVRMYPDRTEDKIFLMVQRSNDVESINADLVLNVWDNNDDHCIVDEDIKIVFNAHTITWGAAQLCSFTDQVEITLVVTLDDWEVKRKAE